MGPIKSWGPIRLGSIYTCNYLNFTCIVIGIARMITIFSVKWMGIAITITTKIATELILHYSYSSIQEIIITIAQIITGVTTLSIGVTFSLAQHSTNPYVQM